MGSAPSEAILKELEREAYAALLRVVYSRPSVDIMTVEGFLLPARTQLNITNETATEIFKAVTTDIELIRRGQRPTGTAGKFTSASSLPPGRGARATTRSQRQQARGGGRGIVAESGGVREDLAQDSSGSGTRTRAKQDKKASPRPIGAPGSSRPRGRPSGGPPAAGIAGPMVRGVGAGAGGAFAPSSRQGSGLARPRSTRSMGTVDPHHLVGRRVWRWYPNEDPERPWVEGFIVEFNPETGTHGILYDPNDQEKQESMEMGFNIHTANPSEYVLGDYFELESCIGSQRRAERPPSVTIPPAAAVAAPAKRRRSASIKVPQTVPFPSTWLETAVLEATSDDLHTMLNMLEMKENQLEAAIVEAEMAVKMGGDLEKRESLERQFNELCKQEAKLMAELKTVQNAEQ